MAESAYAALEQRLGHVFADVSLLESALTHKSFLNENPQVRRSHGERLEFLGDAGFDLVVGHLGMERFPHGSEGELSIARAAIVNEAGLAQLGLELGLGEWLFLGKGEEQSGGRRKPSLLADACEAVVGAIYTEAGFATTFTVVSNLLASRIAALDDPGYTDFKTRLQERAQSLYKETPRYTVLQEVGPDHAKVFQVSVTLGEKVYSTSVGRSKKEAEQRAAEAALFLLEGEDRSMT